MTRSLLSILLLAWCGMSFATPPREFPTLTDLDALVADKHRFAEARQAAIDSVRRCFYRAELPEERYRLADELYEAYSFFRIDSALRFAQVKLSVARQIGRRSYIDNAKLNVAYQLLLGGMYKEASDLVSSIRRDAVEPSVLHYYYSVYNTLFEMMKGSAILEEQQQEYQEKAIVYKDSILLHFPDNVYIGADRMLLDGRYEQGLQMLLASLESCAPGSRAIGPTAYAVSDFYRHLGWREQEKKYLILSAVSDLQSAVMEYISLRRLAVILYEEGDIGRAHRYLARSLEDATFCNARLRTVEVSQVLPILSEAYQQSIEQKMQRQRLALYGICLLVIFLCVVLFFLRRQRRRLILVRNELSRINRQQEQTGRELAETSNIKNLYITKLMMECVSYCDKLDQYRRILNRKALSGDMKGIVRDLKSTEIIDEEWRAFYGMFDRTFLQLFPTFIVQFNELFPPECRIVVKEEFRLTTELRIFALIRLGIDDTERIAILLRYSKSTIYAYRSRIRLRSLCPECFEERIMAISSI